MDDMYREQIIERFKYPHMKGELDPNDYTYEDDNPLCGDRIRIDLRVDADNKITEAAFSGVGCAISKATADLLTESVVGTDLDKVRELGKVGPHRRTKIEQRMLPRALKPIADRFKPA